MAAGKRRTAREMAVQMLYQSDLGGVSVLPQIFNSFDLGEYVAQEAARESPDGGDSAAPLERGEYVKRKKRAEEAFFYAQSLVKGSPRSRVWGGRTCLSGCAGL